MPGKFKFKKVAHFSASAKDIPKYYLLLIHLKMLLRQFVRNIQ
jgi:hypothetical protein